MLVKLVSMIFAPTLIIGTILTCSSYSWLMAWIGLEINLMSFTPILINKLNSKTMETAVKYFLIQAMASMFIMIIITTNFMFNSMNVSTWSMEIISLSLGLKAGLAPVHFWFPQIISNLVWGQSFILLTWQKIAPLILLSFNLNIMVSTLIIMSAIAGCLGGLNQMDTKKLMAFSSIINASWLMALSFINMKTWWIFFILYTFIVLSVINSCSLFNLEKLMFMPFTKLNLVCKLTIFLNIMSLAGMPPFAGFFIKMMAVHHMFNGTFNLLIVLILILSSVISFYFYLRIMYFALMFTQINFMLQYNKKIFNTTSLSTMLTLALSTNLILPILITPL